MGVPGSTAHSTVSQPHHQPQLVLPSPVGRRTGQSLNFRKAHSNPVEGGCQEHLWRPQAGHTAVARPGAPATAQRPFQTQSARWGHSTTTAGRTCWPGARPGSARTWGLGFPPRPRIVQAGDALLPVPLPLETSLSSLALLSQTLLPVPHAALSSPRRPSLSHPRAARPPGA